MFLLCTSTSGLINHLTDFDPSLTMHNVHHMLSLMGRVRTAIVEDTYPAFCKEFFAKYFDGQRVPDWAIDALQGVGIEM
jgi:queuine/archaeosine tRNA-ribosyltransferase